ncbi:MAG: hypothetical protein LC792_04725 [Actinobacteria bacterium]|nr:hypothetical protein [Actinomycetota bacterium]
MVNGAGVVDDLATGRASSSDGFVIDDEANRRRVKALAATVPIEDLDRAKNSFGGSFWGDYDLRTLAIAAIDWIALALGVSSGAAPAEAVKFLTAQAARQQPGRKPAEHQQVATRVLDKLIGAGEVVSRYVDHASASPVMRDYTFRLVYEQLSGSGAVHLRVSEEAINVLVEALDMDIADAQEAQEAWMRRLVERGMLGKAGSAARQSHLRSIQFLERVQSIVRDTTADIAAHDWSGTVADFLVECLEHVAERLRAERELRELVAERRDGITDGRARAEANDLLEVLADCHARHSELHTFLITTRQRFRDAQDAAFAFAPGADVRYDLEADLLRPLLHARIGAAEAWAEALFVRFLAPPRSVAPSLAVLVDEACEAPAERPADEPEEPPIFEEPAPPWWEPVWDSAASVLDEVDHPVALSELLGRAAEMAAARGVDPLLVAAALTHRAYELLGAPAEAGLLAVPTGGHVDNEVVVGPDLAVVRLERARRPPAGALL